MATRAMPQQQMVLLFLFVVLTATTCSGAAANATATRAAAAASAAAKPKPSKNNTTTKKQKALAPALIVFGDSIVDPGNNNGINTIIKANFPPYGHDFLGDHRPTGRFCNGRIPTDFIASRLGIKDLLPAYLQSSPKPLDRQDLLTGVSFASGGTGFDPLTPQLASVISMPDQLRMFHDYLAKLGDAKAAELILSRGVFAICAGSDDVANTYFTMRARSSYDHASYARLLVHHASSFVEDLLLAGARRVAFIGIPPIGCVPSQRTMSGGLDRGCSAGHNEIAVAFNAGLEKELAALRAKYPGTLMVFMDIYGFLYDMMMHPSSYGFKQSTRGCCGTGLLEVSVLCNGLTSAVCDPVGDYLFWDSYHPTEKAYKVLADFVFDNYVKLIL